MFERLAVERGGAAEAPAVAEPEPAATVRASSVGAGSISVLGAGGSPDAAGHALPRESAIAPLPIERGVVSRSSARIRRAAAMPTSGVGAHDDRGQRRAQPTPNLSVTRDSPHVIRRVNAFYADSPRSETKESPLATIARGLEADLGVPQADVVRHWRNSDTLRVAKTAKTNLTAAAMLSFERPIEAAAWLDTPNRMPGQRRDPPWITAVGNLGTVEDQIQGDSPSKYNGGHLIAWEFLNDAANVKGNVAPQSELQNQALFRRIERVLEHTVMTGGPGIELIVRTPYHRDGYTVTYRELFERQVLADQALYAQLDQRGLLDQRLTFAQMAPDTYSARYLTQTGTTSMVPADAREGRGSIVSHHLPDYSDETSDAMMRGGLPKLSILATNYDPLVGDQQVAAFAHVVFLNHRSQAPPARATAERASDDERRRRALEVMNDHPDLTVTVLRHLEDEFALSPTQASEALFALLLRSETDDAADDRPDVEMTDAGDLDMQGDAMDLT